MQPADVTVDVRLAFAGARGRGHVTAAQMRLHQRRHRLPPIGRQVESIQRGRQQFRRRGFQVHQQTERFGEVDVRKVAEDRAVRAAVEQRREDRPPEQIGPPLRSEIEHRARQLREHHACQRRIEGREQCRHVAEFLLKRSIARFRARLIVGEAQEHRGDVGRVVDEDGEIHERDRVEDRGGVEPDPPFVGRIQIAGRSGRGHERLAAAALARDEIAARRERCADRQHLRAVSQVRRDRLDPVLGEQLREGRLGLAQIIATQDVGRKSRQVALRRDAIDVERRHMRAMQPADDLVLDNRAGADPDVVDDQLARGDAACQPIASLERREHLVARGDRVRAQRAGRRVGMELPDRAGEQLQELFDGRKVGWARNGRLGHGLAGPRPGAGAHVPGSGGTCSLVLSEITFVIDGGREARHRLCFRFLPESEARAAPNTESGNWIIGELGN